METAYSYQTLAKRWACSVDTLQRMIRRGELRAFRIGGMIRISADEVKRIEESANNDQTAKA